MGLFSKKSKEPPVYPAVERAAFVRAPLEQVQSHLAAYSSLSRPKHADLVTLQVASAADMVAIQLPEQVHPWQLHNLAFWMLDCPEGDGNVIAWSGPAPTHAGYLLVKDPEIADALCGWDTTGMAWTVDVPMNDVVHGDPVPVPNETNPPGGFAEWAPVEVLFQDPGRGMNETNQPTAKSRDIVARRHHGDFGLG